MDEVPQSSRAAGFAASLIMIFAAALVVLGLLWFWPTMIVVAKVKPPAIDQGLSKR